MVHKAWCCLEKVPFCFWVYLSNFKVTRLKKMSILTQIGRFRTVTPVWIYQWLWNDAQNLKQHRRGALLFFKVIRQFSRSRGTKNLQFYPKWAFPDCNSSLNIPIALKCFTKLNVVLKRCHIFSRSSIKFQGHAGQKIAKFYPNLRLLYYSSLSLNCAFPDCTCNSTLNLPMALK